MTQKVILYTGMLTTLSLCLFVYIKIFTPKDAGTMINTPEASYSSPNTPTEETKNNPRVVHSIQESETSTLSNPMQPLTTMHEEQFTLAQNEAVRTKDDLMTLTLTGFTIERDAPDPNLPYSPDPGIICATFDLARSGTTETLSLCVATHPDIPGRNTGSIKNHDGTITLSILDMSPSTTAFGHPETVTVQITD